MQRIIFGNMGRKRRDRNKLAYDIMEAKIDKLLRLVSDVPSGLNRD